MFPRQPAYMQYGSVYGADSPIDTWSWIPRPPGLHASAVVASDGSVQLRGSTDGFIRYEINAAQGGTVTRSEGPGKPAWIAIAQDYLTARPDGAMAPIFRDRLAQIVQQQQTVQPAQQSAPTVAQQVPSQSSRAGYPQPRSTRQSLPQAQPQQIAPQPQVIPPPAESNQLIAVAAGLGLLALLGIALSR